MSDFDPAAFSGKIPEHYDRGLGPVIFEPYADDLAGRIHLDVGQRLLELAAGTGILTRRLADSLGDGVEIVATDLNEAMLQVLASKVAGRNVAHQEADAMELPFDDESFSAVACQFGIMFFPDKVGSMREAHRVLEPGGKYVFNTWDSIEHNDFPRVAKALTDEIFNDNPPAFYAVPFGYSDVEEITSQLGEAGFGDVAHELLARDCTGPTLESFVDGLIYGNPISIELAELGPTALEDAHAQMLNRMRSEFGDNPFRSNMQAIVFEAVKA